MNVQCPRCKSIVTVADESAAETVQCGQCGMAIPLARGSGAAPATPPRAGQWLKGVALAAVVVVAVVAVVAWPLRPRGEPEAPHAGSPELTPGVVVVPPGADVAAHEREAEALFNQASRKAAPGHWHEAKEALDRLETDFAATSFYAVNRSSIAQLRASIQAAVGTEADPAPDARVAAGTEADAVRVYVKWVRSLSYSWARRRYSSALVKAEALAKDEQFANHPDAARWLVEDAKALLELWQAVEAGAASLKPGDAIRIGGADAQLEKLDDGTLVVRRGQARAEYRLTRLSNDDLLALRRRVRDQDASRDHLALALLWLHSTKPGLAKAAAELDLAEDAGLDVARHRAVLVSLGGPKDRPDRPKARYPTFTGEPLVLEAESAPMLARPMRIQREEGASGGAFVWEPRAPGQNRVGDGSGRIVFYIRSDRARQAILWARVRAPDNDTNSFYLAVVPGRQTRGEARAWHFAANRDWAWSAFDATSGPDRGSRRPTPLPLQPGVNSVIISVRERATALDQIRLTSP